MDRNVIEIINRRSGDLNLQCVEHVESGFTNLTWFILLDNGSLITPSEGKGSNLYTFVKSGNQANLTIDNSLEPFRGLLKCLSSSGLVVSIRVVEGNIALCMV